MDIYKVKVKFYNWTCFWGTRLAHGKKKKLIRLGRNLLITLKSSNIMRISDAVVVTSADETMNS